jgi:hypothetical protein
MNLGLVGAGLVRHESGESLGDIFICQLPNTLAFFPLSWLWLWSCQSLLIHLLSHENKETVLNPVTSTG